ncbi:Lactonase, 7-bladed beta-propeller-domain-containing protein [Mycena floridula]|nr:Lactonase, 7-bladed beta-propeller-domain-containing protein [Mycena floridula]
MVSFTILAGGYDLFIATYLFNANTSSLALLAKYPSGSNPSWITGHPTNKSILYATNENSVGALQSFTVTSSGVVSSAISTVPSGGDSPAFAAALDTGAVAIMNYNTGNGRIIPTTTSPLEFDESAPVITFPPPVGGVSHPHMALQYRKEIFVPDLGADVIWRLSGSPSKITGSIPQPLGSGPRHIAIFEDRLFTLHELSSTLTVQAIPAFPNGTASIIASTSILPDNPPPQADWHAAEILIPEVTRRFQTPYIYVSNRNTGPILDPRGDSIAIFEHVNQGRPNEGLVLVKQVFTGLDQIRGMEIGLESNGGDEFLIAAGVAGTAGVVVYRRVDGGRDLVEVARNLDVPTRTSFVWL